MRPEFMYVTCRRRILRSAMRPKSEVRVLLTLAVFVAWAAGCAAFRVPEEPPKPTPTNPVWSEPDLRDHLEFLNGDDLMGRATGTQGYARAAAYVAARMRGFRLQPAIEGDFRVVYGASVNYPVSSLLRSVGVRDSTTFLPGIDYLPDARTDAGEVRIDQLLVASGQPPSAAGLPAGTFGIIVPDGVEVDLATWQKRGARLAIVVRTLSPRFEAAPISNLLVAQMTPAAAARLAGTTVADLPDFLAARAGEVLPLPRVLLARVSTEFQPHAGAINMLGYFSGKHPVRQGEAVLLCADLDAVGHFGGVPAIDYGNFGISTAALLEVARNLGFIAHRWNIPERSVLVAVWSGSQTEHSGLRYFLENPTWDLEKIRSVIYVGLTRQEETAVRRILAEYDISLNVVALRDDPLFERDVVLLPDPGIMRLARERQPDAAVPEIELPDESAMMDSAVVRARRLADIAYGRTLVLSTDPKTFMPVREDTLSLPQAVSSP